MRSSAYFGHLGFMGIALCLALAATGIASAITREQAIDECKRSAGRPIFQACMKGAGGNRDACFESARPAVQQCVRGKVGNVRDPNSPGFRRWCARATGGSNVMFAQREAAGCFAMPARDHSSAHH
jgi:hypothetical protein